MSNNAIQLDGDHSTIGRQNLLVSQQIHLADLFFLSSNWLMTLFCLVVVIHSPIEPTL